MSSLLKQLTIGAGGEDLGQWIKYFDTGTNLSGGRLHFASTSGGDWNVTFAYELSNTIYVHQADEDGNLNWSKELSITESNTPYYTGTEVYIVDGNSNVTAIVLRVDGQHDDTGILFLDNSDGSLSGQRLIQSYSTYSSADVRMYNRGYWDANYLHLLGKFSNNYATAAVSSSGQIVAERNIAPANTQTTGVTGQVTTTYSLGQLRSTAYDDIVNDCCGLIASSNNVSYTVAYHRTGYLQRLFPQSQSYSNSLYIYGSHLYFLAKAQGETNEWTMMKVNKSNGSKVWFKSIVLSTGTVNNVYGMKVTSSGPLIQYRTSDSQQLLTQFDHSGAEVWTKDIGGIMYQLDVTVDGNWIDGRVAYDGRSSGGYYQGMAWRRLQNPPADEVTGAYTVQDYSGTVSMSDLGSVTVTTNPSETYSFSDSSNNFTSTNSGMSLSNVSGIQGVASGYDASLVKIP